VCGDRHKACECAKARALDMVIRALEFEPVGPQNQWVDAMFLTARFRCGWTLSTQHFSTSSCSALIASTNWVKTHSHMSRILCTRNLEYAVERDTRELINEADIIDNVGDSGHVGDAVHILISKLLWPLAASSSSDSLSESDLSSSNS